MNIYHIGRVIEIFSNKDKKIISADTDVQATLEMWDDNILTFRVAPKISNVIKNNDIVLVDYRPTSTKNPIPKNLIVKIIKDDKGERVWKAYRQSFQKRSGNKRPVTQVSPARPEYVG